MVESLSTDNNTFRYARGCNNSLVDVSQINPLDRYASSPFSCVSCSEPVVAALPKKRRRYFRHKGARPSNCSNEGYLHAAAKYAIADAFSNAIRDGRPFLLKYSTPIICDRYRSNFGIDCTYQKRAIYYDLTKRFDLVEIEASVGVFVADILLRSTIKPEDELLIEIAVTHRCTTEKISSGMKIIELVINSENDIASFQTGIDLTSENVRSFNLKAPKPKYAKCAKSCSWIAKAFFVYRDGTETTEVFDVQHLATMAKSPKIRSFRYLGKVDDYMD